jgi:5-methylcytosine-specific restriction endonuclease McrA
VPTAAKKPCCYTGCKQYAVKQGYCLAHQQQKTQYDKERGNSYQRGYNSQWRQARLDYLSSNPLCVHCQSQGIVKAASVVDHIQPHKGDQDLFWDEANWQALCLSCHNSKTAKKDMGAWVSSTPKNN